MQFFARLIIERPMLVMAAAFMFLVFGVNDFVAPTEAKRNPWSLDVPPPPQRPQTALGRFIVDSRDSLATWLRAAPRPTFVVPAPSGQPASRDPSPFDRPRPVEAFRAPGRFERFVDSLRNDLADYVAATPPTPPRPAADIAPNAASANGVDPLDLALPQPAGVHASPPDGTNPPARRALDRLVERSRHDAGRLDALAAMVRPLPLTRSSAAAPLPAPPHDANKGLSSPPHPAKADQSRHCHSNVRAGAARGRRETALISSACRSIDGRYRAPSRSDRTRGQGHGLRTRARAPVQGRRDR